MRLDFKILWFEDQFKELASQLEEIEDHIRDAGFQPEIVNKPDGAEISELSRQQKLYYDFELVVVDLNLADSWQGDDVVERIRQGFSFTDIMFYSGDGEAELRRRISDRGTDGVYCCDRSNIVEKVIERVEFVRGNLDRLESMRGLTASVVGQCDRILKDAILTHEGASHSTEELVALLDEEVSESLERGRENYSRCEGVSERLESRSITSHLLWCAVRKIVAKDGPFADERRAMTRYGSDVLEKRNTLSHVVEIRGDDGWEVSSTKGDAFTRSNYPDLRKALARHLANFRSLHARIHSEFGDK